MRGEKLGDIQCGSIQLEITVFDSTTPSILFTLVLCPYFSYSIAIPFSFQRLLQNCLYSNENYKKKLKSAYGRKLRQVLSLNTKLKSAEKVSKACQKEASKVIVRAEQLERK